MTLPVHRLYRWYWSCTRCPNVAGSAPTWLQAARAAVTHRITCPRRP